MTQDEVDAWVSADLLAGRRKYPHMVDEAIAQMCYLEQLRRAGAGRDADLMYLGAFGAMSKLHHPANASAAQSLIDIGESVHSVSGVGWTPLHCVKHVEIARVLIGAGADVNARDNGGRTPLHMAWEIDIIRVLLDSGADPLAIDDNGFTPRDLLECQVSTRIERPSYNSESFTNMSLKQMIEVLRAAECQARMKLTVANIDRDKETEPVAVRRF